MIKFFRKIRKSLLSDGKIVTYLKYAIGEIILVVIGILIALQINNWNEARKERGIENSLLIELSSDLEETKTDLISDIEKCRAIQKKTDSIYQLLTGSKSQFRVEIPNAYLSEIPLLFPKVSAYEALQAQGINIVSNKELRKMITDFYQLHLPRVQYIETINEEQTSNSLRPHLQKISISNTSCQDCHSLFDMYHPENYGSNNYLLTQANAELTHMMKNKFDIYGALLARYENFLVYLETLTEKINSELSHD